MSSVEFRKHIRAAIADEALQTALDANAERRVRGRVTAFESLPDWKERRRRAHAVRAQVIERLPEMIASFCSKATANGMHVHRAADAEHAVRIALETAEATRPGPAAAVSPTPQLASGPSAGLLFAKSKSMVSEEIELNAGLQRRGHRVVETDLGEYIVQLRGEKPAHIITPAVHLRRHQVGELFHEKLGLPYTDDIPALTAAARRVLREIFLSADVGVSGVNFGVVETGSLCIVTNEGNGRMVTTVPRVHIALMGIERLVPTLGDLALMLSLLARSATGQKLSVYTQLIHSPRAEGEADGATERHVILVDNGRSRMLDSRLKEALYCIRCGACLNVCPVFREIGGHAYVGSGGSPAPYPGPIGSVISPGLSGVAEFGHLAQASSLCGACKDACPVDIDLPRLLTRIRAGSPERIAEDRGTGLSFISRVGLQAYAVVASSAPLFGLMQKLVAVGARVLSPTSTWMRLPAFTGWGASKDLPRPAARPFRSRWRSASPQIGQATTTARPRALTQTQTRLDEVGARHEGSVATTEKRDAVGRFIVELEALGGQARRVTRTELHPQLAAFLRARSTDAVLTWEEIDGLDGADLEKAGLRLVRSADPSLRVGLTGCAGAIAETGTLVVSAKAGQPLSASLLPEVHIAVLHAKQIVWSLEEALSIRQVREATTTVLITGPSRTADIEMTLTIGVHGPKELIVYVVD